MRGADTFTESLFTMRRLDDFVQASHPLRPIREMVNQALVKMDALSLLSGYCCKTSARWLTTSPTRISTPRPRSS